MECILFCHIISSLNFPWKRHVRLCQSSDRTNGNLDTLFLEVIRHTSNLFNLFNFLIWNHRDCSGTLTFDRWLPGGLSARGSLATVDILAFVLDILADDLLQHDVVGEGLDRLPTSWTMCATAASYAICVATWNYQCWTVLWCHLNKSIKLKITKIIFSSSSLIKLFLSQRFDN